MSLLDADIDTFEISLYYKFVKIGPSKKLVILLDEIAEKQIKEQKEGSDKKEDITIEKLTTTWKSLSWKEQNEVVSAASKVSNQATGENRIDYVMYRDAIIKRCLKSWDMVIEGQPVPVSSDTIDRLPGPVVLALYEKFEKIIDYTEEEVKN